MFKNLCGVSKLSRYVDRTAIIAFLFFASIVSVIGLLPVQVLGALVDRLSEGEMNYVEMLFAMIARNNVGLVMMFGLVYALAGVLSNEYGYHIVNYNNRIIERVRQDLLKTVSLKEGETGNNADIVTRAVSDIEQITRVVAGPLNGFLQKITMFFISMIILIIWDWKLFIIIAFFSIVLYYLSVEISKKNKENGKKEREVISKLSVKLSDVIKNHNLIKAYQTEESELSALIGQSNDIFYVRNSIANKMKYYWSSISLIDAVSYVLIFFVLLLDIKQGRNSLGQIVTLYVYAENIFSAMISISRYKTDIYNSDAALCRVFECIDTYVENETKAKKQCIDVFSIHMRNVKVAYGDNNIIDIPDFDALKGELTIITGESGTGKTTLLKMLVSCGTSFSGELLFDDCDVAQDVGIRRGASRICFQESMLFMNSLKYNLEYAADGNIQDGKR